MEIGSHITPLIITVYEYPFKQYSNQLLKNKFKDLQFC